MLCLSCVVLHSCINLHLANLVSHIYDIALLMTSETPISEFFKGLGPIEPTAELVAKVVDKFVAFGLNTKQSLVGYAEKDHEWILIEVSGAPVSSFLQLLPMHELLRLAISAANVGASFAHPLVQFMMDLRPEVMSSSQFVDLQALACASLRESLTCSGPSPFAYVDYGCPPLLLKGIRALFRLLRSNPMP